GPGVADGTRTRLAEAGDLADAPRLEVEHLERLDPEPVDDARRQLGPDPLDEPRPEVAPQALERCRRDLGVVRDLELRAETGVGLEAADQPQRGAGRDADQAPHHRHHLAVAAVALELQPGDREGPIAAGVDDPLDRAEQRLLRALGGAGTRAAAR